MKLYQQYPGLVLPKPIIRKSRICSNEIQILFFCALNSLICIDFSTNSYQTVVNDQTDTGNKFLVQIALIVGILITAIFIIASCV